MSNSGQVVSGRTHCRQGHRYTRLTTKWKNGTRICLTCAELRAEKVKERRKARKTAPGKTLIEVFAEEEAGKACQSDGETIVF